MKNIPNIAIVDDHEIFRSGIKTMLTIEEIAHIIFEASDGEDFLLQLENNKPDIVLMDISMPKIDGVQATKKAIEKYPDLKILALSMFGDEEYYFKMVKAGVKGFLLKTTSKQELEYALSEVMKGENYFSNELLQKVILNLSNEKQNAKPENTILTKREVEVFKLICTGLTDNEISEKLFISPKTVNTHRTNILAKTGCKNSVSLVLYGLRKKIIDI